MRIGQQQANVTIIATNPGSVYQVQDADGNLLDRIMWDGESPYDAEQAYGAGTKLVLESPS